MDFDIELNLFENKFQIEPEPNDNFHPNLVENIENSIETFKEI